MNRTSAGLVVLTALLLPLPALADAPTARISSLRSTVSPAGVRAAVVRLTPPHAPPGRYDVTTDARGHRVVVWGSEPGVPNPGIAVRTETGRGAWGPARHLEKGRRVFDPSISVTSRGRLILVYGKSARGGHHHYVIRFTTKGAHQAHWSTPRTIPGSNFRYFSVVALLPDSHNRLLLATEPGPLVTWTWSHGAWGDRESLPLAGCDDFDLSVVLTSTGRVQAACTTPNERVQTFTRRLAGPWSLGPTLPLPGSSFLRTVVLTARPDGGCTALMRGQHASLWASDQDPAGNWSTPMQVGRVDYALWQGSVATDPHGDTMAVVRYNHQFKVYIRPAGRTWHLNHSHSRWYHGARPMDDVQPLGSNRFVQAWARGRGLHTRIRQSDGTWSRTTSLKTGAIFWVRVTPSTGHSYLLTWVRRRTRALYALAVRNS